MPTQKKIDQVEDLKQRIGRATITVSADYRGLRVQEMDQMRKRLRAASIEVKVIKNSLLRLAADQTGAPEPMQIGEGPTPPGPAPPPHPRPPRDHPGHFKSDRVGVGGAAFGPAPASLKQRKDKRR